MNDFSSGSPKVIAPRQRRGRRCRCGRACGIPRVLHGGFRAGQRCLGTPRVSTPGPPHPWPRALSVGTDPAGLLHGPHAPKGALAGGHPHVAPAHALPAPRAAGPRRCPRIGLRGPHLAGQGGRDRPRRGRRAAQAVPARRRGRPGRRLRPRLRRALQAGSAKFRNHGEIGGFKVSVIADDKLVNAFAAPGGFTYISTGLLLSAESCAEIAGVMGHELAHVTQKHGVKAIEQAMAAQQLADMILGQGTLSGQAALTILNILQSTKFSRDDEAEADGVGLQIAPPARPTTLRPGGFFQKLLKLEGARMPEILSSHPATDSRIRAVKTEIQKRYGTRYKEAEVKTQPCQKTKIQLGDVKQRIRDKRLKLAPRAGQT
ncbi:MAG: M48 family metalloprotease [bacterium]